ncbi:MAG: flagellar biosynthetic protein FliO [Acetobacteraceae bacterium]
MIDQLHSIPWALAALALTLGAVVLAGRLAARAGLGAGPRAGRRLAVVETLALDSRRRLVIARADENEIVLLIGGVTDQVVCTVPPRSAGS